MRAILLAAGYGTRLRPLTNFTPKCLIPIAGKPLLQIWLERLNKAGVNSFLINTHYLSDQVHNFIKNSPFRNQISLAHEPELLGTAGTLINNIDFYQGSDGMLIHADNYCLADFNAFITAHDQRPSKCSITMMTFNSANPSSCGIVILDNQGVVVEFYEKPLLPPSNLANGAIYLLSKKFLEGCKDNFNNLTDFSKQVLPMLVQHIYTYKTTAPLIDIGSIETYKHATMISNKYSKSINDHS